MATGNHSRVRSAIRSSSQRQTELAASHASTRTANTQSTRSSARHDEATAIKLGRNTYSEIPLIASSTAVRAGFQFAGFCTPVSLRPRPPGNIGADADALPF